MPLSTQTYDGVPGGSNLAVPPQEIPDTQARMIVDGLVDQPGIIRRRGPVRGISGAVTFNKTIFGLITTLDPNGSARYAALYGDNAAAWFAALSADLTSKVDLSWNGTVPTSPYPAVDAKAALLGGAWVGSSTDYSAAAPVQTLALWKGANKADYSTGTITTTRDGTTKIGSKTVTGSGTGWLANVVPGMFLFATNDDGTTNTLIGVVKSVNTNTNLTLEEPALHVCTAKAYSLKSIRGFQRKVGEGRITCSTGSATVNGGLTKFKTQGLGTGVWHLFKAADLAYIGKVSAVTSDIQLTLTANAGLALSNESYLALRADGDWSINTMAVADEKVGFLNCIYAERQWFANLGQRFETTSRVWFSDPGDTELVDTTDFDGTHITIGSAHGGNTPIKALMPTANALLVLKDHETYAITGSSPSQFATKKVEDDGCLSGMAVIPWDGGAVWAGKNGIYFYDGIEAKNIVQDNLGQWYKEAIQNISFATTRVWAMQARSHVFFHFESFDMPIPIVKGITSDTPDRLTIVINMDTGAITFMRNVGFRASVVQPTADGNSTFYAVWTGSTGYVCDAEDLFEDGLSDTIACLGDTAGPDFFIESKKYNVGDSMRKKLFKQLAINYLAAGGDLKVDTVIGLNEVGRTSLSELPATVMSWDQLSTSASTWDVLSASYSTWDGLVNSVYRPKRIKFLKRTQHFAFRIYQEDSSLTRVILGPFQLGFKLQRPGRI